MINKITPNQYILIKKLIAYFGAKGLITNKELEYNVQDTDISLVQNVFNNENEIEIQEGKKYSFLKLISSMVLIEDKLNSIILSRWVAEYLLNFAKENMSLSIKLNTDFICFSEDDPFSKNINYTVSIYSTENNYNLDLEPDVIKIGEMELSTSNVNLLNLSEFDIDIFDSVSSFEANANFSIIDVKNQCVKEKVLPNHIVENLLMMDSLFLLNIKNYVLHKNYRGYNLTDDIFNILRVVFPKHLFILKPFPLQHSATSEDKLLDDLYYLPEDVNLNDGIKKLIKVYTKVGFETLKTKTKEPYMVMLSSF